MHAGLESWARDAGRGLVLEDDESDPDVATLVHGRLLARGCGPVLGPYGSDTTRAVARTGAIVWNHGAAADDVQQLPGVVSVATPASRYLVSLARAAASLGAKRIAALAAPGRFARLAREGLERETATVAVDQADTVLLCGPVEWEAARFRELQGRGLLLGGVSPGLPSAPQVWPEGTLAPVQWHPELGGPAGIADYVAAQAYAVAVVAERCLELDPVDPVAAARALRTETFFGAFELDPTGVQVGHRLAVVRWQHGAQHLVLADAA
jgi:ABC-type branched-subunit amino acid transport system substrate-binding protein